MEMNYQNETNEEPTSDYGYEECAPTPRRHDSFSSEGSMSGYQFTRGSARASIRFQETPTNNPHAMDCQMPAERLARKQRTFSRRGGECHSLLLKSAVLAAMDTQDEETDDELGGIRFGRSRRDSAASAHACVMPPNWQEGPTSPRKRARLFSVGGVDNSADSDGAVASASELLRALCTGDDFPKANKEPVRGVPRRTSRRTSYDSKISDLSEGDGLID